MQRPFWEKTPRSFFGITIVTLLLLYGCAGATSSSNNLVPAPAPPPVAISVSVSPTASSVQVGQGQAFTATVTNDSSNKGVSWTLSGSGCSGAACGTLSGTTSASGAGVTYTAPASVPTPATVTVTATSVADGTKSAAATVTITAAPAAIIVSVSPTTASVQVGAALPFTATVQNDSQNKGVTWTLSGTGCSGATCGTLSATSSASGTAITYTAPASVPAPATVTLTATSVTDGTKSGAATITITAAQPAIVVTLSLMTASVQVGKTQAFTATVQNDAQNKGVTWALSGTGCSGATCGTLSAASSAPGTAITYTAPASVPTPATVTLTATSVTDGTKSAAATITITATAPAIVVTVTPMTASVPINGTQAFTATVQNDAQNKGVTWGLFGSSCSEGPCGTLSVNASASGVAITYTAPPNVPVTPTVSLTATSVADNTKTATAVITVTVADPGVSVTVTPKRGGMPISQSLNLTATVTNDVGSAGVTWTASSGTFSAQTVTTATYVAPGTAGVITVTATSIADVTKSATTTIGVTDLAGVTTYHNDLSRDGVNSHEYALTTSNVAAATFGKLFSCSVDGAVYAQPLWVSGLTVNGAKHNVILVATQHDSLFAFDADTQPCAQLWQVSLIDGAHGGGGSGAETSVPAGPTGNLVGEGDGDITPEVGVTGTPVIDPSTNTLYVVSKSVVVSGPTFFQRLHAIDLATGNEKFGGPSVIAGTFPGTGDGGTTVTFNAGTQNQRPGLALANGVVYVAWASHEDTPPFYGWIIGYNASTLAQVNVLNVTPNAGFGGIWMGGGAPAVDASSNVYVLTGNGNFDASNASAPNNDYGDSFLKLSSTLGVSDWFTPSDQSSDNSGDQDFGAGGAAILVDQPSGPVTHLIIGGGKDGFLYLLNRDDMGELGDSNAWQRFNFSNPIFSTGAFWNNSFYLAGVGGPLKAYSLNTAAGQFATSPASQSSSAYGFPGATPSVSSTGTSNGIVWALDNSQYCTPQSPGCGPAVLHAYDATNLATELWNSGSTAGNAVKFTVPTVANGKVYIGTRGSDTGTGGVGELDVYGLLTN